MLHVSGLDKRLRISEARLVQISLSWVSIRITYILGVRKHHIRVILLRYAIFANPAHQTFFEPKCLLARFLCQTLLNRISHEHSNVVNKRAIRTYRFRTQLPLFSLQIILKSFECSMKASLYFTQEFFGNFFHIDCYGTK